MNCNLRKYNVVGKSVKKLNSTERATGAAIYTTDMTLPGMYVGKMLRSPYAHANIKSINAEKAEAIGATVLTWEDVPRVYYSTAGYPKHTIVGMLPVPMEGYIEDKYILDNKVRHYGEPVLAVAAKDEETAQKALDLIEVEYEVLPAVFDVDEARKEDAPDVHLGIYKNCSDKIITKGDAKKAFKEEAEYIYEDFYEVGGQQHACMETSATLANYDSTTGYVTLWATTQVPFHIRRNINEVLGIPMNKIRVIKPPLGGGFGERQMPQYELLTVALAIKTGHPVKIVTTREENMATTTARHPMNIRIKTGLRKDGTICAMDVEAKANAGAYTGHTPYVAGAMFSKIPYKCENVDFNAHVIYTNLPDFGAYRGYGNPQISFARETQIDKMVRDLGEDPIEWRIRNFVEVGEENPLSLSTHWILEGCGIEECFRKGAKEIGFYEPKVKPESKHKFRGRGVAAAMHVSGTSAEPDFSSAQIIMHEDGTIMLLIGSPDLGQGSDTSSAQIAAETIGIRMEDVSVISSDTDTTSFDGGSYASRQSYVALNAVKKAAEKVKKDVLKYAFEMHPEVHKDNMETYDGWVVRRENGEKIVKISDVAFHALYFSPDPMHITESASYRAQNCPPAMAAHFAEVEVDIETGDIEIVKYVAAHDCGTAINPAIVEGQIEGAVAQGIGYTLSEYMTFDENGRLINDNFTNFKVPRAMDMPFLDDFKSIIVETYEPSGPFGAKSVAEMGVAPVPAAIANALYDAIGIRFSTLPITKDVVVAAVEERKKKDDK
ncbi:MAG: molybdopterin-dependent oxidoreductase [Tissierellaceae bacterium]|nr:molybdopterin-dependent oxidoreductase [Tissierellaceae bacterium]